MPVTPGSAGSAKGKEMKFVVVGSGGVGKSAITIRFVTSQFYDRGYNPTIEDSYRKQFVVDEEAVTLEILDTAGQEEYALMADQWYKFGHGFLLVYSITDRPTFDALYGFHQDVLRVKDRPYVPCVVASNKCDLARLRQVGQFEGRDMAKSISAPFIECSASDGVNIDVAFRELVKLVRKDERRRSFAARNQHGPPSSSDNSSIPPLPMRSNSYARRFDPPTQNAGGRGTSSPTGEYGGLEFQQAQAAQRQASTGGAGAEGGGARRGEKKRDDCQCVLM